MESSSPVTVTGVVSSNAMIKVAQKKKKFCFARNEASINPSMGGCVLERFLPPVILLVRFRHLHDMIRPTRPNTVGESMRIIPRIAMKYNVDFNDWLNFKQMMCLGPWIVS